MEVVDSCFRGYQVYQEICTPVSDDYLNCKSNRDKTEDRHVVASCMLTGSHCGWLAQFHPCAQHFRRDGMIDCIGEGIRRYPSNLLQGRMEIPCKLVFYKRTQIL